MVQPIMDAWHALYNDYCTQLDREQADKLSFNLVSVKDTLRGRRHDPDAHTKSKAPDPNPAPNPKAST